MRRGLIIILVLAGLGLITWAGAANYHARRNEKIAEMTPRGQQLVLTPDGGTATPNTGASEAGPPPSVLLGKAAPNFTLIDTHGKKISLASYKGRPVLVNFWATWCGPCKYEIPWLADLRSKYAGQGFEILGVSSDELEPGAKSAQQKADITAVAEKLHVNYPVLFGGESISESYGGVDVLPQSFYIDKAGKVVAVITGAGSRNEAEGDIKKAIGSGA